MNTIKQFKSKITDFFKRKVEGQLKEEDVESEGSEDREDPHSPIEEEGLGLSTSLLILGGDCIQPVKVFSINTERLAKLEKQACGNTQELRVPSLWQDPRTLAKQIIGDEPGLGGLDASRVLLSVLRVASKFMSRENGVSDQEQDLINQIKTLRSRRRQLQPYEYESILSEIRVKIELLYQLKNLGSCWRVESAKKVDQKFQEKTFLKVRNLHNQHGVPASQLSKRFGISKHHVRTFIISTQLQGDRKQCNMARGTSKLGQQEKRFLRKELTDSHGLVSLAEVASKLKSEFGAILSISSLRSYIRNELRFKFKNVSFLSHRVNIRGSLIERQIAAYYFIKNLWVGKTIINVDESALQFTVTNRKGWVQRRQQSFSTSSTRLSQVSIIAGLSSENKAYFSINSGLNNSKAVYDFLLKLVIQLDKDSLSWRERYIIMLDNASYHRSSFLKQKIQQLAIPIMFLGPYHFKLAPVEKLFAIIKRQKFQLKHFDRQLQTSYSVNRDPGSQPVTHQRLIILAQEILRTRVDWSSSLFKKSLIQALKDIQLETL